VTVVPTVVLPATTVVPNARSNNLQLLNLKDGISKNIQKEAVLEHATPHTSFP
jgi:hypothetical protein